VRWGASFPKRGKRVKRTDREGSSAEGAGPTIRRATYAEPPESAINCWVRGGLTTFWGEKLVRKRGQLLFHTRGLGSQKKVGSGGKPSAVPSVKKLEEAVLYSILPLPSKVYAVLGIERRAI